MCERVTEGRCNLTNERTSRYGWVQCNVTMCRSGRTQLEQARPSSARPAASLFVPQDGEASHHGRKPRSCVDSEAIGTCPQLHVQADFVMITAFTKNGMALCSDQDLQWLRALPANCQERPRMLFGEQTVTSPLAPPLRTVPDGTCAAPLCFLLLCGLTDAAPPPQVIS